MGQDRLLDLNRPKQAIEFDRAIQGFSKLFRDPSTLERLGYTGPQSNFISPLLSTINTGKIEVEWGSNAINYRSIDQTGRIGEITIGLIKPGLYEFIGRKETATPHIKNELPDYAALAMPFGDTLKPFPRYQVKAILLDPVLFNLQNIEGIARLIAGNDILSSRLIKESRWASVRYYAASGRPFAFRHITEKGKPHRFLVRTREYPPRVDKGPNYQYQEWLRLPAIDDDVGVLIPLARRANVLSSGIEKQLLLQ